MPTCPRKPRKPLPTWGSWFLDTTNLDTEFDMDPGNLPKLQALKRRFEAQTLGTLQREEKLPKGEYQKMKQPESQ